MKSLGKIKGVDFFRKLPADLTEATLTGASLSIVSTFIIVFLLVMEFASFMTTKTDTKVVIDQSPMNELLRVNFNVSFSRMTCEHLTLDVSDSLGSKKINLSKTLRKVPIDEDRRGPAIRDETLPMPKYDEHDEDVIAETNYTNPVNPATFAAALDRYSVVIVNFYAPWCPYCQRLGPTWESVLNWAHEKYPAKDKVLRMASVDCTKESVLCNSQMITGFPSIRVYRNGSDRQIVNGFPQHESYHGDRTAKALEKFVESLTKSVESGATRVPFTRKLALGGGCQMSGFVLVKKVPGTMHFHMKQNGLSFDVAEIDVTHNVHAFTFGNRPSPKRQSTLARLHPNGFPKDWADKLQGQSFISAQPEYTHEHFMQLTRTTLRPSSGGKFAEYDAYEYTVHSHSYTNEVLSIPAAKFSYYPGAMQVLVTEQRRHWYHFLTTTCAIIGGVFTVCGILDGISYSTYRVMKKVELGKQG